MKLLIVEDNLGVRSVIRSLMAAVTSEIIECADGTEALALYNLEQPDLVLMDIQLGATDGIAAARQIRAADPAARVIMVTNYDQLDLREAARQAGACGYVLKENLLELVGLVKASGDSGKQNL
jgi:DNA-binding NarL/FixJ family response regulator